MSQELHVLQCYSCETFQVHIVKKSNKWECKVCGEKQSLKKVFGRGSGKDCRTHVQRLNEEKRKKEISFLNKRFDMQNIENVVNTDPHVPTLTESKWQKYLSEEEENFSDDPMSSAAQCSDEKNSYNLQDSILKANCSTGCAVKHISVMKPDEQPNIFDGENVCGGETHHKNTYAKFLDTEDKSLVLANGFHNFGELSKTSSKDFTQKQSTEICFSLLPGTSTEDIFLEDKFQQEIQTDLSDCYNEIFSPADSKHRLCNKVSEEHIPFLTKGSMNSQRDVKFLSNIQSGYEKTSSIKSSKGLNKFNHIFEDKYNEDELDKILNL